jgi:hypothetical protein
MSGFFEGILPSVPESCSTQAWTAARKRLLRGPDEVGGPVPQEVGHGMTTSSLNIEGVALLVCDDI